MSSAEASASSTVLKDGDLFLLALYKNPLCIDVEKAD